MKIGIGQVNGKEGFKAGLAAAGKAMAKAAIDRPDLALAFCHHDLDADEFFRGLQSVLGKSVPIVGGSAVGIICNEVISYRECPAGLAVIQSDRFKTRPAVAQDLDKDEQAAGAKLAEGLSMELADRLLLVFYDSIKVPGTSKAPPFLNASGPLIKGIEQGFQASVPIVGAGLIGDYQLSPSSQFCGSFVSHQCALGLMFSGNILPYHRVMHGCTPLNGSYHTITKMEGAVIYELDGRPIVELIDELYGGSQWRLERPLSILTIGRNHGERFALPEENSYVNRLITGCLPDGTGIGIFEPDFQVGTEIQFMLRDTVQMVDSAKANSAALMEQIQNDDREPLMGFYIDCAGRTAHYSNTVTEEAAEVQAIFNRHRVPLFGFYSGVEIAPLSGRSRGLDWTGVLLVITGHKGV